MGATRARGSKPQRDYRESWIWKFRRGVEAREGHVSMGKEELAGEQGRCGTKRVQNLKVTELLGKRS